MLSILGNRKTIVSILTMVFLIVGVQGMSYGQDLTVSLNTTPLSPATVDPGGDFTISVTVTTTAPSPATTLIFYRSDNNAVIETSDEPVGVLFVPAFTTASSQSLNGSLSAPNQSSTYNYGAYVLPVSGERNTNNNASSTTATLTVRVSSKPDLQVTRLYSYTGSYDNTGFYSTAVSGTGNFTLQATVTNQGNATFNDSTLNLQYYFSTSLLAPSSVSRWRPISPVSISSITTGASTQVSISLLAPYGVNTSGIYYYYVRVEPVNRVSNPANNPNNVYIAIRIASADLVVDTPTVDKSTLAPSESFTLTTTVRNQGSGTSSANTTLQYYRSTDSTLDRTTDTSVGTTTIGALSGYSSSRSTLNLGV